MNETKRFLVVSAEGESFALSIASVLEITVPRNIQKDQKLSENFAGKIEYRGNMIPVMNLKKVLQLPGKPGNGLIVIKSGKGLLGVLVDSASELLETNAPPEAMPRGVMSQGLQYFAGILRNRDDLVLLLSEEGLLS